MTDLNAEQVTALVNLSNIEWKDLHHSRIQEWSALGVVAGVHLALTQMPKFLKETGGLLPGLPTAIIGCLIGIGFVVIGALLTCRHRRFMQIMLKWIFDAESKLGLVKSDDNPIGVIPPWAELHSGLGWRGLSLPRLLSTSGLILFLYGLFIIIDLAYLALIIRTR
jgi:hypothetical protein